MSHTPGPWSIEPHGQGYALYSGRDAMRHGLNLINMVEPDRNWEANARLIAAAPDLLEAAREAKKYLEPDLVEPGRTVFWRLVDAIAKAEGKS